MRQGGSYKVDGKGNAKLVERTQHHPQGDRARDEKGQPLAARRVAPAKAPSGETASPEPAVKAAPKQPKKEA